MGFEVLNCIAIHSENDLNLIIKIHLEQYRNRGLSIHNCLPSVSQIDSNVGIRGEWPQYQE